MPRIYLSPPHMSGLEQQYVQETFASNWIAPLGPQVDAFEAEFAATVGAPYALALSSGTAALHLALAGVGPGDEVLVSTLTFSASANPIVYQGARPVFIDSEPTSWNLDPVLVAETIERKVRQGKLPKAVVPVHLYGQSADLDPLLEVCGRYEIPVIEDAAEALGATYKGRAPGTFGRAGIFSFNGNKIITTSGGGMLVSADKGLSESLSWDILFDRPGSGGYNGTIESELCIETERKKMPTTTIVEMEGTALPTSVDAEVRYHMDISFRVAITPFVARQNANVYLLMNVGNMLSAGEPMLSLSAQPHWKVPVYCAFPEFQRREKIGELAVDVNSGAILLEQSFPSSPQEIERHAQVAYDSLAASSARA